MALDPRLLLTQTTPDALGAVSSGLGIANTFQNMQRAKELFPLQKQQAQLGLDIAQEGLEEKRQLRQQTLEANYALKNIIPLVESGDLLNAQANIMSNDILDDDDKATFMSALSNPGQLQQLKAMAVGQIGESLNLQQDPAAIRTFNMLTQNMSEKDKEYARRMAVGLDPKQVGSATLTTATTQGLTDKVASSQEQISKGKNYGGSSGTKAAELEGFAEQWEANRDFILSNRPEIERILQRTPGSTLGKATQSYLASAFGSLPAVDAQAKIEQFGAFLLQGVPFAPGAQSDKELQARAKLISDQLEDPRLTNDTKMELLGRFIDWQDTKANQQKKIAARKMGRDVTNAPSGVPNEVWNMLTPDEKREFLR